MDTPERLIRAARHYEKAVNIMIRQVVKGIQKPKIDLTGAARPSFGSYIFYNIMFILGKEYNLKRFAFTQAIGWKRNVLLESILPEVGRTILQFVTRWEVLLLIWQS